MPTHHIDLYIITTLSNLHAGKGDSNYGIVDNEVQRDPVQGLPVIFSSSLKGALRELFDRRIKLQAGLPANEQSITQDQLLTIFGNEVKKPGKIQSGKYIFHEARLLSLPVRSDNRPYFNATTPTILQELKAYFEAIAPSASDWIEALSGLLVAVEEATASLDEKPWPEAVERVDEYPLAKVMPEDIKSKLEVLIKKDLLEQPIALFFDKKFKEICERLPVIARNQLNEGVSENLFYEEVVPRQARFLFFVERPANDDTLHTHLKQVFNNRIQVGANASIGYGVCKIERIYSSQP